MALVQQLPVASIEEDRTIALPSRTSATDVVASLTAGLEKAAREMDDVSLEIHASADRMHLKFRAVKHRPQNVQASK
jgi:hypothetical protein